MAMLRHTLIMKTTRIFFLSALVLLGAGAARALDTVKGPAQVDVVYFEREKFTDVRDGEFATDKGRDYTLDTLKEYLTKRAARGLLPGQKLAITITDVDLAGDYEPWRGPQWSDVRIVKDIYPPRIAFMFRLTDADGTVLKEGKRDIRDMAFMMKITMTFRDDPLRHEKTLLDDWLSDEFRPSRKG